MDKQQIQQMADGLAEYVRSVIVPGPGAKRIDGKAVGYRHPGYEKSLEIAKGLAPHAFAADPGDLLRAYRPLEQKIVAEYRISIYQPKTNQEFNRVAGILSRVFSDGLHTVEYPEVNDGRIKEGEAPSDYFENDFFDGKSVVQYVQQVVLPFMLGDPNGVLALDRESVGEGEFWKIVPTLWPSKAVLDLNVGKYVLILTDEKSNVTVGQQQVREGLVLKFYNPTDTWLVSQTGEKDEYIFEAIMLDRHGLGEIPAKVLGGVARSEGSLTYWDSFVGAAVPSWNNALREESDLKAAIVRQCHPRMIYLTQTCKACGGVGHMIDVDKKHVHCAACNGIGKLGGASGSPFVDIEIDSKSEIKPQDAAHLLEQDTTYMEFARASVENELHLAIIALNLQAVEGVNDQNSGAAKRIDRAEQNEFFKAVASQGFDLVEFIYRCGVQMRYSETTKPAELVPNTTRPLDFDYASLDVLLAESREAKAAGVSPSIIRQIDKSIAIRSYGFGSEKAVRICAAIDLDPYYGMSPDSLMAYNSMIEISPADIYLHTNIDRVIREAIAADPSFLKLPPDEQQMAVDKIAASRGKPVDPPAPAPFPPLNQ